MKQAKLTLLFLLITFVSFSQNLKTYSGEFASEYATKGRSDNLTQDEIMVINKKIEESKEGTKQQKVKAQNLEILKNENDLDRKNSRKIMTIELKYQI